MWLTEIDLINWNYAYWLLQFFGNFENLQNLNYTHLTLGGIHFDPYLSQSLQNYSIPIHNMLMCNPVDFYHKEENTQLWIANNYQ